MCVNLDFDNSYIYKMENKNKLIINKIDTKIQLKINRISLDVADVNIIYSHDLENNFKIVTKLFIYIGSTPLKSLEQGFNRHML